ncbi:MAG: hypothetical protein R2747_04875 [Pyrinomonadaceae bacterium]
MPLPGHNQIRIPILQELYAVGGTDEIRFLYQRLIDYFPAISPQEIHQIKIGNDRTWRLAIQRAGKILDEEGFLNRHRGIWTLTGPGQQLAENESSGFTLTKENRVESSHGEIQQMVCEIGRALGFYSEKEFEFYDVIWRETPTNPRLSHIFEVQSKGNIDSAFAKLKRAFEAQRTKPFLVISTERDLIRARKSLEREFRDLEPFVTVLTFSQIKAIHENLSEIGRVLAKFLEK